MFLYSTMFIEPSIVSQVYIFYDYNHDKLSIK